MSKAQDSHWPGLLQCMEGIAEAFGEASNCTQYQSMSDVLLAVFFMLIIAIHLDTF